LRARSLKVSLVCWLKEVVKNRSLIPHSPAADLNVLEKVEVIYETLPGWDSDITGCRKFEELPENCQKYVKFIEDFLGVKIQVRWYSVEQLLLLLTFTVSQWIGVGPARDSTIRVF
jgi:adenylosuccinate synthase